LRLIVTAERDHGEKALVNRVEDLVEGGFHLAVVIFTRERGKKAIRQDVKERKRNARRKVMQKTMQQYAKLMVARVRFAKVHFQQGGIALEYAVHADGHGNDPAPSYQVARIC
jgi:hypothetical protein